MNIEAARVHRLKNKLAIILGFCELLLGDMAPDDPRRPDVLQIQEAGKSALAELPPMPAHELEGAIGAPAEANHGK
jgi:hypothetical protein